MRPFTPGRIGVASVPVIKRIDHLRFDQWQQVMGTLNYVIANETSAPASKCSCDRNR